MLVDGLTAANDLGLTTPMPFTGVIHTDARRRAIEVDGLTIEFKRTAPSKHYWADGRRYALCAFRASVGGVERWCPFLR
jgi:uncharacterized protein DUF6088